MPLRLDKQTAQDYSVVVEDPDPDASDPDEWREFFSQFGEVASISIALDNGHLISLLADCRVSKIARAISEHRQFKSVEVVNKVQTTEEQTPEGQTVNQRWMENEVNQTTKSLVKVSTLFGGDPERRDAMLSQLVEDAVQRKYPVARVFCIFEHEAGQRCCLDKLSNGIVAAVFDIGDLKPEHKFRGQNVLKVVEAPEPTGGLLSPASMWLALPAVFNVLRCTRRNLGKAQPENKHTNPPLPRREQFFRLLLFRIERGVDWAGFQHGEPVFSYLCRMHRERFDLVCSDRHRSSSRRRDPHQQERG